MADNTGDLIATLSYRQSGGGCCQRALVRNDIDQADSRWAFDVCI